MCCNYRVKLTGEGIVRASFPRREPSQTISRTMRIGPTKAKAGQAGVTGWAQLRKPRSVVVQIRLSVCQQGTPHRTGKCTLGQSGGASRLRCQDQDVVELGSLPYTDLRRRQPMKPSRARPVAKRARVEGSGAAPYCKRS